MCVVASVVVFALGCRRFLEPAMHFIKRLHVWMLCFRPDRAVGLAVLGHSVVEHHATLGCPSRQRLQFFGRATPVRAPRFVIVSVQNGGFTRARRLCRQFWFCGLLMECFMSSGAAARITAQRLSTERRDTHQNGVKQTTATRTEQTRKPNHAKSNDGRQDRAEPYRRKLNS